MASEITDDAAAELYDATNGWDPATWPADRFYVGIDPDQASLRRAQRRTDIEWRHGRAEDIRCLVSDEEIRSSLSAIRRALRPGGQFGFEARHPQARAWEDWNPTNATTIDWHDEQLIMSHRVDAVCRSPV